MAERWQSSAQTLVNHGAEADDNGTIRVRLPMEPVPVQATRPTPPEIPGFEIIRREGDFPLLVRDGSSIKPPPAKVVEPPAPRERQYVEMEHIS